MKQVPHLEHVFSSSPQKKDGSQVLSFFCPPAVRSLRTRKISQLAVMVPLPFLPPELSLKSFLPPPSSFFAKAATRGEGKGGCPEEEEEEEKEVGAKKTKGEKKERWL